MEIALQHPAVCQQRIVSRLFCTSRGLSAVVNNSCSRQLTINFKGWSIDSAVHMAAWIANHADLISSLHWAMPPEPKAALLEAQTAIAAALQQAATSPGGLKLQQYHSIGCPSGAILQQLPSATLTSLSFSYHPDIDSLAQTTKALANLTGLRTLTIQGRDVGPLLVALQHLTKVSLLELNMVRNVGDLQQLPGNAQLKRMQLCSYTPCYKQRQQLQLAHLTTLEQLEIAYPHQWRLALPGSPLVLQPSDSLPQSLTSLSIGDSPAAQPLLHLQNLQQLVMDGSTMPAQQLLLLQSTLPKLTQLQLAYTVPNSADAAAAAWGMLPVHSLVVESRLSMYCVQQLPRLRCCLNSLELFNCWPIGATAAQLAAVLQQLTSLQELTFSWVQLLQDCNEGSATATTGAAASAAAATAVGTEAAAAAGGMAAVTQAIAGLPRLHSLCIEHPLTTSDDGRQCQQALESAAVTVLTAAVQLTRLNLTACGLLDDPFCAAMRGLTRLKKLVLDSNPLLTDRTAAAIGQQLLQLRWLSMNDTGITDAGMECLAALQHLQGVDVHETAVSEAARMNAAIGIL